MLQLSDKGARPGMRLVKLTAIVLLSGWGLVARQAAAEIHEDAKFELSLGGGLAVPADDFKSNYRFAPTNNFTGNLAAKTGYHFTVSGGYYLLDKLSVGLNYSYSQFDIDPAITSLKYRVYSIGMYGKYHFTYENRITPYVRVLAGIAVPNFNTPLRTVGLGFRENGYGIKPEGLVSLGARISTTEWGGFFFEVGYRYSDVAGARTSFKQESYELPADVAQIQISAGFSFDIASSGG